MPLSDVDIKRAVSEGWIGISPYDERLVEPASYDIHLGNDFRWYKRGPFPRPFIDPETAQEMEGGSVGPGGEFLLSSGMFALATTVERIRLDNCYRARLEGKSSLGRLGLVVHTTAGFIDPGFEGQVTLELLNVTDRGMIVRPGMRIGQISFDLLETPCEKPYGHPDRRSKYQGQSGATASMMHRNYEAKDGQER